ncbi:MAG: DUF4276 family protein [Burkholderiales bacterium]|nr:DUF4276 family protein [Burkholderiales bacterium]
MVTVGFVVEGNSDEFLPQSEAFRNWLRDECNIEVIDPVVNAGGNGNMCRRNIGVFVEKLKIQANPDKVIVLADLDPDKCAPCIERRKEIIGHGGIDLIVIARKAIESWFLADTEAMRRWTGNINFYEPEPETLEGMPWERLKQIGREIGHGPGNNKPGFANKFIRRNGFDVRRAANHANCPSARYFIEKLRTLGQD